MQTRSEEMLGHIADIPNPVTLTHKPPLYPTNQVVSTAGKALRCTRPTLASLTGCVLLFSPWWELSVAVEPSTPHVVA